MKKKIFGFSYYKNMANFDGMELFIEQNSLISEEWHIFHRNIFPFLAYYAPRKWLIWIFWSIGIFLRIIIFLLIIMNNNFVSRKIKISKCENCTKPYHIIHLLLFHIQKLQLTQLEIWIIHVKIIYSKLHKRVGSSLSAIYVFKWCTTTTNIYIIPLSFIFFKKRKISIFMRGENTTIPDYFGMQLKFKEVNET